MGGGRARFRGRQETASLVEAACVELRLCGSQRPSRAAGGFRGKLDRTLEEGCGRRIAATRLRLRCRTLEVFGNTLVRDGGCLGPMPGAAVRVELRICSVRQR